MTDKQLCGICWKPATQYATENGERYLFCANHTTDAYGEALPPMSPLTVEIRKELTRYLFPGEYVFGLSDLTSRYSIVDLDTGTVLGTNIAIVPSRFITENELSNDSAAISAAKEYGYVLYANLDERITS